MNINPHDNFFKNIKFNKSELYRISETVSGKDSEIIPKVDNAGSIYFDKQYNKFIQIMHNGLKVFTDSHYGTFNVEIIRQLRGHHEPQEEVIFYEILKKIKDNGVMIELGSFWGYYSMWFKSQIKDPINLLVEPMYIDEGIQNFKINNLKGAKFIKACVGEKYIKDFEFKQIDDRDANNVKERIVSIPQVTLDTLIVDNHLEYVDIVHVDIQGYEIDMMKGAKESLKNMNIGYFFISTHSPLIHLKVKDILKIYGYKLINDFSPRESYTSDGCIVACRPDLYEKKIKITKQKSLSLILKKSLDHIKHIFAVNG